MVFKDNRDISNQELDRYFYILNIVKLLSCSFFVLYYIVIGIDPILNFKNNINYYFIIQAIVLLILFQFNKNHLYLRPLTFSLDMILMSFFVLNSTQLNDPSSLLFVPFIFSYYFYGGYKYAFFSAGIAFSLRAIINIRYFEGFANYTKVPSNGDYIHVFNLEYFSLITVMLILLYYFHSKQERVGQKLSEAFKDMKNISTFPQYNPNPVMLFYKKQLVPYNDSAVKLLNCMGEEKKQSLQEIIINARDKDGPKEVTLSCGDEYYLIAITVLEEQVNLYFTDITKLVSTQKSLQERDQYSRAILESIPGFVSWVDRDLKYLGVNENMANFFSLKNEDFIGKGIGDVVSGSSSKVKDLVKEFFNSNEESMQQHLEYSHQGEDFISVLNFKKYNDGNNVIIVSIDVTEHRKAEKQIIEERAKAEANAKLASLGELTAGIAHEIANPLSVIDGLSHRIEIRKKKGQVDDEFLEMVSVKIKNNVNRIHKIIKGLKNLSRSGEFDEIEEIHFAEVLEDVMSLLEKKFQYGDIQLEIKDIPQNAIINAKFVQLAQVIIILLNNAVDAITDLDEKWIVLETKVLDDWVEVSITDSGNGIPKEIQEKIFDSFFTTKKKGQGTGLGLNLARKIITAQKGTLVIDNDCPNTRFVLQLLRSYND
jgi:PAS domain S-box-containing protein